MKEDYIETLHQQDKNLRDAIRLEEEALPPMPADLNARLMQRVEEESAKEVTKRRRVRVLWPVVAAACVAALIAVFLTPPKGTPEDGMSAGKPVAVKVDKPKKEKEAPQKTAPTEAPQEEVAEQPKVTRPAATTSQPLLAQKPEKAATSEEVVAAVASSTEQSIPETPRGETTTVMLTERDIPITRPENYQYTPEEIALMKKQANEAYLKWVELELEISKYTLEKMAQK